jgi:hypothetical protein
MARAIDPGDYVCTSGSPINLWLDDAIGRSLQQEPALFLTAYNLLADLLPTYEAIFFQTSATPQYFGANGEHTKAVLKAERELKGFWDIDGSGIEVVAMHGNVLVDTLRTAATYQALGIPAASAAVYARMLRDAILQSETMPGGDHPFFTFNAVAATSFGGAFPDKLVVGDGILAGYDAIGFGDVAPEALVAHEYAHHIQFDNGYAIDGTAAERTRFGELSADAMAAYWLTHKRGATMNRKRVEQFLEVFFQIGDCSFASAGHHGTPNQRLAAARFGFDVADQAQKQGQILGADEFHALFLAEYPSLIAPDAR